MQAALTFLALAAYVSAQAQGPPPGCLSSFDGSFSIRPTNITSKTLSRDALGKRQAETCSGTPIITLKDGVLKDQQNRQGEIVANHQFQFDNPIQQDSIYLDGFSICANGSLAVGNSAIFYQCISGDFANLYNTGDAAQCDPVYIDTIPCAGSGGPTGQAPTTPETGPVSSVMIPTVPMTAYLPTTTPTTPPTVAPPPPTLVPAPYPVANTSTPVGTASAAPSTSPSGTAPPSFNPANGADSLTVGGLFAAAVAGVAVFAML
ncbi:MAG: hypothetical protein Q9214_000906 [Letrouitia sp. 1 TL-2023]